MKKISMYSHTPGFRSWGREWSRQVEIVAVVEELDGEERTYEGCDFVITEAEFAKVKPLTEHPEFPLCIGDGDTPAASKREAERLQRERDAMARAIAQLRVQREAVEREIAEFEASRDELQREVKELRDAANAAEQRALAAESKLEERAEGAESSTAESGESVTVEDSRAEPAAQGSEAAEGATAPVSGSGRRNRPRGGKKR